MERNLFQINLDNLQFSDIEQFNGIKRPENERPKEGIRLDFKEEIPEKIGDTVTAFANTYGGLIILGVKSDKNKQNIPVEIAGISGTKDIKPTIVNKILSTVYPRPSFSIGVAIHDKKLDHVVVVIRVDESRIAPHMYIAGQSNKISVRVEDENRYASLQEIEILFEKRKRLASEDFLTKTLSDLYIYWKQNGQKSRSGNHHKISLIPFDDLGIRLDRNSEQIFYDFIGIKFRKDKNINTENRHAEYYQIEAPNMESDYHRIWRLYTSGAIEFISQVGKGQPRQENIGDMIVDVISIIEAYKTFLEAKGFFGKTYLKHEILIAENTTKLLPKMLSSTDDDCDYDTMNGISLKRDTVNKYVGPNKHVISRELDFSNIENPDEIIAENFLEHLRMLFQGSIDFKKLLEDVKGLRKLINVSNKNLTG